MLPNHEKRSLHAPLRTRWCAHLGNIRIILAIASSTTACPYVITPTAGSASAADPACTGGCTAYELCTSTHGCCLAPGDPKEAQCTLPSGTVMRLNFEAASEKGMEGSCTSGTFVGLYDSVRQLNTALTCAAEFPRADSACPMYRGAWKIHTVH